MIFKIVGGTAIGIVAAMAVCIESAPGGRPPPDAVYIATNLSILCTFMGAIIGALWP